MKQERGMARYITSLISGNNSWHMYFYFVIKYKNILPAGVLY